MKNLLTIITTFTLVGIYSVSVMAAGPNKGDDSEMQPFQIIMSVLWAASGGFSSSSDPFSFGDNKTAEIQSVACRMRFTPSGASEAKFNLVVDIEGGTLASATVIASDMVRLSTYSPSPVVFDQSNDLVSACVGKQCNSLDDGEYVSLTLHAERSDPSTTAGDELNCLISGVMYKSQKTGRADRVARRIFARLSVSSLPVLFKNRLSILVYSLRNSFNL
jgi:hypothetical protein